MYNNVLSTEASLQSSCSMKSDDTLLIRLLFVCVCMRVYRHSIVMLISCQQREL